MFITGILIGIIIGSTITLTIHSCLILSKSADDIIYKSNSSN